MRCISVAAVTLDGKIAHDSGHPSEWTSLEDKKFLHGFLETLEMVDVVVIGHNTYKTAPKFFSKYNCIVLTPSVKTTERKSEKLLYWNPAGESYSSVLENIGIVAVLGGTQTYTYFLEQNLLDEIYLTIEPLVFGRGLPLFESSRNQSVRFALESCKQLNDNGSLLLHYVKSV